MQKMIHLLKRFAVPGNSKVPIVMTAVLVVLGVALVAMIPLYPLWGLQLIGLSTDISFRSYCGSLLLIGFYLWIRSLSQKPPKMNS